ncbi:MAG: hypothetical protein IKI67_00160 [Bacteroidales bacterium]|nr:hypothetical protein [Bacteroidales bacterium]
MKNFVVILSVLAFFSGSLFISQNQTNYSTKALSATPLYNPWVGNFAKYIGEALLGVGTGILANELTDMNGDGGEPYTQCVCKNGPEESVCSNGNHITFRTKCGQLAGRQGNCNDNGEQRTCEALRKNY